MGLELLDRPSPPVPQQFMTYPLLLQLINEADPRHVYSDDPKRFEAWNDTVPPEDKPVVITSQVLIFFTRSSVSVLIDSLDVDHSPISCH